MKCQICERACNISEGKTGACGMYENREQEIVERFPDRYLVVCPISIETMPVLHYHPGGKFLQISTIGCNFDCPGCISTVIVKEMDAESKALKRLSPKDIVLEAKKNSCLGITFLMNDPIASLPTFIKIASLAKKHNLLVGCSSNCYFTEISLARLVEYLDFINIGVKGLSDHVYQNCGASSVRPVLRNIKNLYEAGVHLEISCIYQKENEDELKQLARMIAKISKDIPLQIMRFIPLERANIILEPSIKEAEKLQKELSKYLIYVYLFNSPGTDKLNTLCPECGRLIIKRDLYGPMGAKLRPSITTLLKTNTCPSCGFELDIKGTLAEKKYQEEAFKGGYPFTRALEMIEAILINIGVTDKKKVVEVWEEVLKTNKLDSLHHDIQKIAQYINTIREFGRLVSSTNQAEELALYLEDKISMIKEKIFNIGNKPRVYYAMGKARFCIKGERLENQLVEAAGGISVNKELDCDGRPGMKITVEQINKLNPEVIFISSFLSNSVEDFYDECCEIGIDVEAVRNKKIYTHLAPVWDFGSPRWIFGLMYIANVLHPELFHFDLLKEADIFYYRFYNRDFYLTELNRSFSKPSSKWQWVNN